ncbi:MAG: SagB/ThcOx family dehydrogenase [Desulfobacteraceae bacterium]|nr:SagB/ThcOx family dehydrogenase [Desulfobacteraceae bacterium]
MDLEQAIDKRRSCRKFEHKKLKTDQIYHLMWAGEGDTGHGKRAAPSAGGIYPIRIFPVENVVVPTIWAPLVLVLMADFDRMKRRYGRHAKRFTYIEAGHIAQNICLMAVSMGLGSVCIGAFSAKQIQQQFNLVQGTPIYIVMVGYKKG